MAKKTPFNAPRVGEPKLAPPSAGIEQRPSRVERPRFLDDILFHDTPVISREGGVRWQSPGTKGVRKVIELLPESPPPIPGQRHRVQIVRDSEPSNPEKGILYGIIMRDAWEGMDTQKWRSLDEELDKAEPVLQKLRVVRSQLYDLTGKTVEQRAATSAAEQTTPDVPAERLPADTVREARRKKALGKLYQEKTPTPEELQAGMGLESEVAMTLQLGELMDVEDPTTKGLLSLRYANLREALASAPILEAERNMLVEQELAILRASNYKPSGVQAEAIDILRARIAELETRRTELERSSPEAFYGLYLRELKQYQEATAAGRIIETPYVRKLGERLWRNIRSGQPTLIYGHLGAGKTELALHVVRERFGKEPLLIAGSKDISRAELYGAHILDLSKVDLEEARQLSSFVEKEFNDWRIENAKRLETIPEHEREQELERAHDRVLHTATARASGGTLSRFILGPVLEAAEQGRPVILDEINGIQHEILISLNHILTRRAGDTVTAPDGRTIVIQEGFAIIATANLNEEETDQYIGRQQLDIAFLSRFKKLEYDYLPQYTDRPLEDELGPGNTVEGRQLYHFILSLAMDERGNMELPEGSLKKLWALAVASRVAQDSFSGKRLNGKYYFRQGARTFEYRLQQLPPSLRHLKRVMQAWVGDNKRYELDYYLWQEYIKEDTLPIDRAFLYQLYKGMGFFATAGWPQTPDYGTEGRVAKFEIEPVPTNPPPASEFIGPRGVIRAAFGEPPVRNRWPVKPLPAGEGVIGSPELAERLKGTFELMVPPVPTQVFGADTAEGATLQALTERRDLRTDGSAMLSALFALDPTPGGIRRLGLIRPLRKMSLKDVQKAIQDAGLYHASLRDLACFDAGRVRDTKAITATGAAGVAAGEIAYRAELETRTKMSTAKLRTRTAKPDELVFGPDMPILVRMPTPDEPPPPPLPAELPPQFLEAVTADTGENWAQRTMEQMNLEVIGAVDIKAPTTVAEYVGNLLNLKTPPNMPELTEFTVPRSRPEAGQLILLRSTAEFSVDVLLERIDSHGYRGADLEETLELLYSGDTTKLRGSWVVASDSEHSGEVPALSVESDGTVKYRAAIPRDRGNFGTGTVFPVVKKS